MKAEHAKARADRKAKLQEEINQLDTKTQGRLQKAKERRDCRGAPGQSSGAQGKSSGR
jgi:hypothetical protein